MKLTFTSLLLILNFFYMYSQELDYYPKQNNDVSDQDYNRGITILEETYQAVRNDSKIYNYADYWNLAVALYTLKDDVNLVRKYFFKSKELNNERFATVFLNLTNDKEKWKGYLSVSEYENLKKECREILSYNDSSEKLNDKSLKYKNDELKSLIWKIGVNDNKYRSIGDLEKQKTLDELNIKLIDSLYEKYGEYIGKTAVGNDLSDVMWSVIQHSNIESMEKYINVITQAVENKELDLIPLKMLIDRIHVIKYNCQIFGSQFGVDMASSNIIEEVKLKYNLLRFYKKPNNSNIVSPKKEPLKKHHTYFN